jgi:hypothetical protein
MVLHYAYVGYDSTLELGKTLYRPIGGILHRMH